MDPSDALSSLSLSLKTPENISVLLPTLETLPAEIFIRVVDFLRTAKDITSLSQASRQLYVISKEHAWRRFVLSQFPTLTYSLQVSGPETRQNNLQSINSGRNVQEELSRVRHKLGPQWEHLAKSLTSQSRAWDRRAFAISRIAPLMDPRPDIERATVPSKAIAITAYDPEKKIHTMFSLDRPDQGRTSTTVQTTGYHPVVDARLEFSNCLHNKKEIVAWSTGASVFIRVRRSGYLNSSEKACIVQQDLVNDVYNNVINCTSIKHHEYMEGYDDVMTLKIVPPTVGIRSEVKGPVVDVIVGRASGYLNRFSVNLCPVTEDKQHGTRDDYSTVVTNSFLPGPKQGQRAGRRITSTDVNGDDASHLACASDGFLSLYQTESFTHNIEPFDEIEIENQSQYRTRAVKYLSREKVVVGLEGHHDALRTFQVTPEGLRLIDKLATPLHGEANKTERIDQRSKNSIYALEPVSAGSRPGGNLNGDVFLSGSYDGVIRLFDLRAALTPVALYGENNDSPVYSLATYGQERFVAGTARSKLQIYDFRLGHKQYSYTEALPCQNKKSDEVESETVRLFSQAGSNINGLSTQWRDYYGSRIYIPQFPTRTNNTLNLRNVADSIENLGSPCSSLISKVQPPKPELQPQLCQSNVFSSFEAFYKQEDFSKEPLWHTAPSENEKRNNPPTIWEDCRFDLRKEAARRCEFHKEAAYNHDASIFLYGFQQRHRQQRHDHLETPIFSIASPSPVSPILYVGAIGTVYEMAVGEFGLHGETTDPYFNDAPYSFQTNTLKNLSMYENGGIHYQHLGSTGDMEGNCELRNAQGRLDQRWLSS